MLLYPSARARLAEGEGVRTELAICVEQGQARWVLAALRTDNGFQTAWQGGGHHAELRQHQHSTCHRSQCTSHAVLEMCPSVWATQTSTQPLQAPAPRTACTGLGPRPVRSPGLYQAEVQELNEFLKLVSAFFFFLISPLGREGKSCRLLQASLCHINSVISQKQ